MTRRDYRLYLEGYQAAAHGSGLSDSPYGGKDGDLWRRGVRSWLDEQGDNLGCTIRLDLDAALVKALNYTP